MFGGAVKLVNLLADGHIEQQRGQRGLGAQRGDHGRINAARHAHHKTLGAGLDSVIAQPVYDVLDDFLRLHGEVLCGMGFRLPLDG